MRLPEIAGRARVATRRTSRRVPAAMRSPAARAPFWRLPLVLLALLTSAVTALAAALALSPLLQVRTIVWTGTARIPEARYAALESATLGRPLLLLSERQLRSSLQLDNSTLSLRLRRHLPHTLEARLEPRCAVASLEGRVPLDAEGHVLGAEHAVLGLPKWSGFALDSDGRRLEPTGRALLRAVESLLDSPALVPAEVRRTDDNLEIVLAESGCRARLQPERLEAQLLKLRILVQGLGHDPLPASVDLRFRDQVVVRRASGEGRATSRRQS